MPAIIDYAPADIGRDPLHRVERVISTAERLAATERKDRHRELAFLQQQFIVSDILIERTVIGKSGAQRTRLAVSAQILLCVGR